MHKQARRAFIIIFWLAVWQIVSLWVDNAILLVGPLEVIQVFVQNIAMPEFWKIVFCSFTRIGLGFFLALLSGLALGALGYRFRLVAETLEPVVLTLKSIPVASFVVLLLIWFGSSKLSFFVSFLIVFPNVYVNTMSGFMSTDKKLLEMARVFGMSKRNRFLYIYRPALLPYLSGCLRISLGMSWKSGVAAEVIGLPDYSLGERLYMSKIYLDTAGLFAWTLTVILLSFLFEKAVLYLLRVYGEWKPYPKTRGITADKRGEIVIDHVSKTYGDQHVLCGFDMSMREGGRYLLMAPSGAGKTTLLRILNRLEKADSGMISGIPDRIGMVFQEDRLCEEYDTIANVMSTIKTEEGRQKKICAWVAQEAARILPEESLTKPVGELSGGMRRRVTILRAMLSGAPVIIMDEPFTGLDEDNRRRTAEYILSRLRGRTLLVTTHREEDVELLQGEKIEVTVQPRR